MLNKEKMLIICPQYMGYWKVLKETFEQNYEVTLLLDRKKSIRKLKKLCEEKFDILFIIRGDILIYISNIVQCFHAKKKVLYEWDSINNFNYLPYIKLFDSVKTFDMKDAKNYSLKYLPLFYSKNILNNVRNIDVLFIGIWHSDRQKLLQKFYNELTKLGCKCYFKLYYKWYFYLPFVMFRKINNLNFYTPFTVSQKKLNYLYGKAKSVLDLGHPAQSGFTMRTMEALGNDCKLITANKNIKVAPFYNSNNIYVFDRRSNIDFKEIKKFIVETEEQNVSIKKFEITEWAKEVLS